MKTKNLSDKLFAEYSRIWAKLHDEAQANRCKGDIVTGWDWPTLQIVKPAEYARLQAILEELRGLRSAGLVAFVA